MRRLTVEGLHLHYLKNDDDDEEEGHTSIHYFFLSCCMRENAPKNESFLMTEPAWVATPGPSSHWGRSMLWPVQTKGRCTWLTGGEGEITENICILLLRRTGEWMLTGRQQYPLQQCSSSFSTHTSPAEDLPRCTFRFSRSAAETSILHFQQLVGHGALLVPLARTGATPHQCLELPWRSHLRLQVPGSPLKLSHHGEARCRVRSGFAKPTHSPRWQCQDAEYCRWQRILRHQKLSLLYKTLRKITSGDKYTM